MVSLNFHHLFPFFLEEFDESNEKPLIKAYKKFYTIFFFKLKCDKKKIYTIKFTELGFFFFLGRLESIYEIEAI